MPKGGAEDANATGFGDPDDSGGRCVLTLHLLASGGETNGAGVTISVPTTTWDSF